MRKGADKAYGYRCGLYLQEMVYAGAFRSKAEKVGGSSRKGKNTAYAWCTGKKYVAALLAKSGTTGMVVENKRSGEGLSPLEVPVNRVMASGRIFMLWLLWVQMTRCFVPLYRKIPCIVFLELSKGILACGQAVTF